MLSSEAISLQGCQLPRISHIPTAAVSGPNVGQRAVALASHAGLELDPWQQWVLKNSLLTTDKVVWNPFTELYIPQYAAFEVGLVVSRQNGKGSILEARELAGLFLLGERLIIHSAHEFPTSLEAFERVLGLIENTPDLWAEVAFVKHSHGEEGIFLKNGQKLRFKARTKSGARGFTADCVILDEAMILGTAQVAAMMPTVSARPNPQIWYTGSAGNKESTQFGKIRRRGIKGDDPRLLFAEWSINPHSLLCSSDCEEHDDMSDPMVWPKANPGIGYRITMEHIAAERRSMDDDSFGPERCGVGDWPKAEDSWDVISEDHWHLRRRDDSITEGKVVFGVHTAPDRSYSAIFACGLNARGESHIEITSDPTGYDYRPGIGWVLRRLVELVLAHRPYGIALDRSSQTGTLIEDLEAELKRRRLQDEVQLVLPNRREYAQGCADLVTAVVPKKGEQATLVHIGQEPLDKAVAAVGMQKTGDLWVWSGAETDTDITPLPAATLALLGFKRLGHTEPAVEPFAFWA